MRMRTGAIEAYLATLFNQAGSLIPTAGAKVCIHTLSVYFIDVHTLSGEGRSRGDGY